MQPMAHIALRAARRAGQMMLRAMDRVDELRVESKAPNDFVTNIDRDAEAMIIDVLRHSYPDHAFVGEESGRSGAEDAEVTWIIDPLDGTLNYLQGIGHYCISIAAMRGRHIEHAVIIDPPRNEEFVASRGYGAQLNGKRIRVSGCSKLEDAVLGSGIPPGRVASHLDYYAEALKRFTGRCRAMRRSGSAALDLAYVAAGRLDGYFEMGLGQWDIAAGVLLVREAGGFISDLAGGESYLDSGDVLAANPRCFKAMVTELRALRDHLPD